MRGLATEEAYRLRNAILLGVVVPLLFIVPGAFLGGISWQLKQATMLCGISLATIYLLYLAWRGAIVGIGISILMKGGDDIRSSVADGALGYIRFVSAIIASEIAVGLMLLPFPAHRDPLLALFLIPTGIAAGSYALWQGGVAFWPHIVWRTILIALAGIVCVVVLAAVAPQTADWIFGTSPIESRINNAKVARMDYDLAQIQSQVDAITTKGSNLSDSDFEELERLRVQAERVRTRGGEIRVSDLVEAAKGKIDAIQVPSSIGTRELWKFVLVVVGGLLVVLYLWGSRKTIFRDAGNWIIVIGFIVGMGFMCYVVGGRILGQIVGQPHLIVPAYMTGEARTNQTATLAPVVALAAFPHGDVLGYERRLAEAGPNRGAIEYRFSIGAGETLGSLKIPAGYKWTLTPQVHAQITIWGEDDRPVQNSRWEVMQRYPIEKITKDVPPGNKLFIYATSSENYTLALVRR
jgi:hypothetical protein